jgi:hypothetical protein
MELNKDNIVQHIIDCGVRLDEMECPDPPRYYYMIVPDWMEEMLAPEYIFSCKKCQHRIYVGKFKERKISQLPDYNCPNCGEEGYLNWISEGEGDFADFEGEKIDDKKDTDCGCTGCEGFDQYSNEEGL